MRMHSVSILNNRLLSFTAITALLYSALSLILLYNFDTEVLGVNAFIKPLKFGISAAALFLFLSWYSNFVPRLKRKAFDRFVFLNIGVMAFELSWIMIQASRGTLSHFNTNTLLEEIMFGLMGIAIAVSTAWTWILFRWTFRSDFRMVPGILWSVRFGILYFIVFGFSGFIMGAQLNHYVGAELSDTGLPVLGWSTTAGDLRIPHFFGLHAIQLLPLLSHVLRTKALGSVLIALIYGACCIFLLYLALLGQSPL